MSKYYTFLFSCILFFTACQAPEEPSFKKIENIKVVSLTATKATVTADAIFHNPNSVSCQLVATDLDIIVNTVNVGKIKQTLNTTVPANSDFKVPVRVSFPPQKVMEEQTGGLIGGVISALSNKNIDVQYVGKITVKAMEIPIDVEVDYKDKIPLKNN